MKKQILWWLCLGLFSAPLVAAEHHHDMGGPQAGCQGQALTNVNCGLRPTSTFDNKGRLWVSWVDSGHVYVAHSDDFGKVFSPPVAVNSIPEPVEASGESRAKIAVGKHGEVFVSYTRKLAKRFTGNIRFSRSLDDGRHFGDPITVNDDHAIVGHRFDALWVTGQNRVYLVWIDKRDREEAEKRGETYHGAAVYYAVSSDNGRSFGKNHKLVDHSCECCRIALGEGRHGVVAVWRNIFGSDTRDHVIGHVGPSSKPVRVSVDDWRVDACPHHGPALAVDDVGDQHVAWYTQGEKRKGLFYARLAVGQPGFSAPMALGAASRAAGHASLVSDGANVHIAWREFDGQQYRILYLHSSDRGQNWSTPIEVMQTAGEADYPFLLRFQHRVYLAWQTRKQGYRLMEMQ